jgi:drug/metabolite transporter (DMT)-like permease
VPEKKNNSTIVASLLLVVILWGGNNTGTKWLVSPALSAKPWPPIFTGSSRFLVAGFILFAILRFTNWLGPFEKIRSGLWRQLWLRGGLSLALYIVAFAWALRLAPASHIALYLGASPVWALVWEERPRKNLASAQRYGAALLALAGVFVLIYPALQTKTNLDGEFCGLAAGLLWTNYSRQCRTLAAQIGGLPIAAHSMWMSGVWLLPFAIIDVATRGIILDAPHLGVQTLCILFGGVVPYALWNSALRQWRTSQVMLFNNFIPLTTAVWVHFCLHEKITPTFYAATFLIIIGVLIGQTNWQKVLKLPENHLTKTFSK